jgi:hypothetical protein
MSWARRIHMFIKKIEIEPGSPGAASIQIRFGAQLPGFFNACSLKNYQRKAKAKSLRYNFFLKRQSLTLPGAF